MDKYDSQDKYESQDKYDNMEPSSSRIPPLINDHCLLPLPTAKYAPRTLTLKGQAHELNHFLAVYEHLCAHFRITNSREKCRGLLTYCSPKAERMVERLPSYIMGNYNEMIKDLEYFGEEEEDTYNTGRVEAFAKKWRRRRVESKKYFKHYHRKYLELVGKALGSGHISEDENNRHFWGGIHQSLRKKIEDRMLVVDPDLDVSIPFPMHRVVKAVEHIFNRHRFDQHLLEHAGYNSSSGSESEEEERHKPSKKHNSETESEEESEKSDYHSKRTPSRKTRRHSRDRKAINSKKEPFPKRDLVPKKIDNDELGKLAQQMGKLSLTDSRYRALYVDIIREMMDKPPTSQTYNQPFNENQFQRPPLPRTYNRPPNNDNQYSRGPPPRTYDRPPNNDNHPQRDLPPHQNMLPHQSYGPPPGMPPRTEVFCYGCGKTGHRMLQGGELNALLNQRVVVRNEWGKLQWPDGSAIRKDRDDSWVQAIGRAIKRTNIVQAEVYTSGEEEEVYHYVGVAREEDDASSDEQEELGWLPLSSDVPSLGSGLVRDRYALGAERNPRISRSTRKQVQYNLPGKMQGVKNLPETGDAVSYNRQGPTINHGINSNRYQSGDPKRVSPMDVHQGKFEAKVDNQLLPMDIDQEPKVKLGDEAKKVTPNPGRSEALKIPNPRTREGRTSLEIVHDIMRMPLTITVEEAVNMSRSVQRDLTSASKQTREAYPQIQEKTPKKEKNALGANVSQSSGLKGDECALGESRDGLLMVLARIGRATMPAVFDSGSQVNVLSEKWVRSCGLPVSTEGAERYRITGVNGGLARCVGIIPKAKIYLTDSELVTVGDLIVVEHSGFDLLLGRPWATMNGGGLREAREGTYLIFKSGGLNFEVNACPNPNYDEKQSLEVATLTRKRDGRKGQIYTLSVKRHDDASDVPDSEEEWNLPDVTDQSIQFDEDRFEEMPPHQSSWRPEEADDEGNGFKRERSESGSSEEEEDRCWLSNPPGSRDNIDDLHSTENRSIIIESKLQESFIRMVQKGVDEARWNQFCKAEKRRRKQDKDQWKEWKQKKERIDVPRDAPDTDFEGPSEPPEPSATLATPEPEPAQPPEPNKKRPRDPELASVIVAARRSKRVRKESRKARESEDWQKWRRQVYEREEKRVQKTVTYPGKNALSPTAASYGAKVSILPPRSKEERRSPGQTRDRPRSPIPRTKKPQMVLVMDRDEGWPYPICDRTTSYAWISMSEMAVLYDWMKNLPGSRGNTFFVHRTTPTTTTVNWINGEIIPLSNLQRTRSDRRVLNLILGTEGTLTPITGHTMKCVLRTKNAYPSRCECTQIGKQYSVSLVTQQYLVSINASSSSDDEPEPEEKVCLGAMISLLPSKVVWKGKKSGRKTRSNSTEEGSPDEPINDGPTLIMDEESRIERRRLLYDPMSCGTGTKYPWITQVEIDGIKAWVKNIPDSQDKRFFVHPLDEDGLAVTLASPENLVSNLKKRKDRRILEIWRGTTGIQTWVPFHTIACATSDAIDKVNCPCALRREGTIVLFDETRKRSIPDLRERFKIDSVRTRITGWNRCEERRTKSIGIPSIEKKGNCRGCPASRNLKEGQEEDGWNRGYDLLTKISESPEEYTWDLNKRARPEPQNEDSEVWRYRHLEERREDHRIPKRL